MCDSVSLPTKSLASTPHDIYGPPRDMPYRETFTEAALSFYLDDNLFNNDNYLSDSNKLITEFKNKYDREFLKDMSLYDYGIMCKDLLTKTKNVGSISGGTGSTFPLYYVDGVYTENNIPITEDIANQILPSIKKYVIQLLDSDFSKNGKYLNSSPDILRKMDDLNI
jgi:hypothetical protein